jgi:4-hydroxyphenylpyruvate dioxygenase
MSLKNVPAGRDVPAESERLMIPTLSQVSSLHSSLARDVEDYSASGCRSIEVWLTKLEEHLKRHTLDDLRRLLAEHDVALPVASFQGGLLASQGEERRAHWEHFTQRLELCRELGIGTLVVACDVPAPLSQQLIDRVSVSLTQVAQEAGRRGVRVALEFQRTAAFGNNLQTAVALVSETGSPHLGICFDVFHYYCGPSKLEDLGYLTPTNLFHVQLCDIAGVPRELATDGDRILPGDGDLELRPIVEHLRQIGYGGCVSVEVMNPQIWPVPARQFGEVALSALRKVTQLGAH